ncbi:hypothetical protein [Haloarchaeobius salinus]|uniref:hypothetical protein n=1 Tax=Haloarchaeobius salinus TaxID=1198298 RepID=UPI00210ABFAF|nr:hypothetical protein [Haloarchaeobius salinus]
MGETATVGDRDVVLSEPRLRKGVYTTGVHDPRLVAWRGQYIVVTVTGSDLASIDDLRTEVPGGSDVSVSPTPTLTDREYAVPLPPGNHERAELVVEENGETARWSLPAAVQENVGNMPRFGIESSEFVRRDGDLELEMTVRNEGDRDGQFVATASSAAFSGKRAFEFPVAAGESYEYSGTAGGMALLFDNDGGGTFVVEYPGRDGVERHEIRAEMPGTTAN